MTQSNDMPDEIYVRLISGNAKGGHKKKTLSAVRADSPLIFERTRYILADLTPLQSPNRAVELKQGRDALSSAIKRLETIKETFPAISVDSDIKIYRDALATLDRLSAPVGVPDGYVTVKMGFPNITGSKELVAVPVEFLKSDGSFNKLQTAAPTPAPTAVDLDGLKREIFVKLYPNSSYMPEMNHLVSLDNAINFLAAKYDFVRKV